MKSLIGCIIYLMVIGILLFFIGRIVPKKRFHYDRFPYRLFGFERGGQVYHVIGIRKWKNTFPDMSIIFPKLIPSKKLPGNVNAAHIELMIQETCVAELTHFLLGILGLGCVLVWRSTEGWILASLYALGNVPYILIQRYNRPKLVLLLYKLRNKERMHLCGRTEQINEESCHSELQHGTRA